MFHCLLTIWFSLYCFYFSAQICAGCFPSTGYGLQTYYPVAMSASRERAHADAADLNLIYDDYPPEHATPRAETNQDFVQAPSKLNCHGFDSICRWSNTNEDELDWSVLMSTPEAEPWFNTLRTTHLPDASAAVLVSNGGSGGGNAWSRGQLVSDQLPCIASPLQLTATVWRSHSNGPLQRQPNLQICSRNVHDDSPSPNCNLFPIQNGVPVAVNVPEPRDPTKPAQIIILGDNVEPNGGAIFLQDIFVDGELVPDCSVTVMYGITNFGNLLQQQQPEHLHHSNTFQDPIDNLVNAQELGRMHDKSKLRSSSKGQFIAPFSTDPVLSACLKLSCNPAAEKDCSWKNGVVGWMASTGTAGSSNPLTGILIPPTGTSAFLVAAYNGDFSNATYHIISPLISIPASTQPIYFCFYEYFALGGARFTMCTDEFRKRCFYSKIDIQSDGHIQESRRWNLKCTELPSGKYQIHVWAENKGPNKGDIGFVPLRVTRDPAGNEAIC